MLLSLGADPVPRPNAISPAPLAQLSPEEVLPPAPLEMPAGVIPGRSPPASAYPPGRPLSWVLWPVVRKSYAPGTLPNPSGSWWKHRYLAFRGNFFFEGYDTYWQFDYPWHGTAFARPIRPVAPLAAPPPVEPIPSPPAEPQTSGFKRPTLLR
jgi:hypothetical protein